MSDDGQSQGGSARWIKQAVENSLKRLGTDRIDLYQQHVPDRDTPFDETLGALTELVNEGKVREIGCSNYAGKHIAKCNGISEDNGFAKWASAQNNYSLLERSIEPDVTDACATYGLGILPYFPLASGLLTGKYRTKDDRPEGTRITLMAQAMPERAEATLTDENFAIIDKLRAFAEERGHTLLDLAMSWLATKPVIASVIAGATKPEQVKANAEAASWRLTDDEMKVRSTRSARSRSRTLRDVARPHHEIAGGDGRGPVDRQQDPSLGGLDAAAPSKGATGPTPAGTVPGAATGGDDRPG